MPDDNRLDAVRRLLFEYVKSPSLTHLRDPYALGKLAQEIVKAVTVGNPIWRKWDPTREELLKSAAPCWIPTEALRDYLNGMPGPALTTTDVAQRLRAFHEEAYASYPREVHQPGCLALFETEMAQGTELPAIIGALQEFVEREDERLRIEQEAAWRQRAQEERFALEQRFLSGADCKWTPVNKSAELYSRINGRVFRLSRSKDRMWSVQQIASIDDATGELIGTYRTRGDVTKALAQVAYAEPRERRR
jgi:hypothetical protein